MVGKNHIKTTGSPTVEVGEIDTRAPFRSVKDAVSLFGEGAFSGEKPSIKKIKSYSAERLLGKETKVHLTQKELNKLTEQLKNTESTKVQALAELQKAQRTVEDLTQKLKSVNASKDLAIKETEASKDQVKGLEEASDGISIGKVGSLKQELQTARESYLVQIAEVDTAKQELRSLRQDCDLSLEANATVIKQAAKAVKAADENKVRVGKLSEEIAAIKESISQVKLATMQVQEQEAKIVAEKDAQKQSYKASIEDSSKKLLALKKDFDPLLSKNMETQLATTMFEVEVLQKQVDYAKAPKTKASELDDAKESLHEVAEEESALRSLVESLKLELENVKRERSDLEENGAETESDAGNLHLMLQEAKHELNEALVEESKVRGASEEMITTLHQVVSESENARREVEGMKKQAEELKKVAESTRILLEEAEKKLRAAVEEAEEAKAAEARALEQIKFLSAKTNATRSSTSESSVQIRISTEEFESLKRKVEEGDKILEMKLAAATAQVEAVKASENQALKKLERMQSEIDAMKAATQEALKRAEMAEAAKKAVEAELRRWREREQKKEDEAASRILTGTEMFIDSSSFNYLVQNQNQNQPMKETDPRKLERARTSVSKKLHMPNLGRIFHRKRNQVGGASPSYLPGEKPL